MLDSERVMLDCSGLLPLESGSHQPPTEDSPRVRGPVLVPPIPSLDSTLVEMETAFLSENEYSCQCVLMIS